MSTTSGGGAGDANGARPTTDAASSDAGVIVDAASSDARPTVDAAIDAPGDLADARVDGGRIPYRALAVATGEVHTCAVLDDHNVKCWGDNSYGQLGYGDAVRRGGSPSDMGDNLPTVDLGTGRTATAIAAGRYSTCAILDDGSLRCWGWAGLLGNGVGLDRNVGDAPGEMGDHLPALDFEGRKAVHLAMGNDSACASMDDDTIWCWDGNKPWFQFWLPTKEVSALAPTGDGTFALYADGSVSPQLPNGTVPLFTSASEVLAVAGSAGNAPTCYLLADHTTTCMEGGATRRESSNALAIGVELDGGLCSALSDGSVQCDAQRCVSPTNYPCTSDGAFVLGAPAVAVTSNGTNFACALLVGGQIKCWDGSPIGTSPAWLGSELDATTLADGGVAYGPWHAVALGMHP
ncbi:MAG TPA: hypothetical protein VH560_17025 [Polyangia bacterium]|nr:hypothetical protein [Polyangia bacterium]